MSNGILKGSTMEDVDSRGAFKRKDAAFRHIIEAGGVYPPAKGRYILYVSYLCPWASRCLAVRVAKGLEDVIELSVTSPVWALTKPGVSDHEGWVFDDSYPGTIPDPLGRFTSIRDIYDLSMHQCGEVFETRYTVPVLFDRETLTIVNNESSEIMRMFNNAFNDFAAHPDVDLCPPQLLPAIDEMNELTYESICNGVYKCGFAQTQEAYDDSVNCLFDTLDIVEQLLTEQRYLAGDGTRITEADVRLFTCLVRFDEVYNTNFKCNKRLIRESPVLLNWMRDVYQTLDLAPTINMKHIKDGYYKSLHSVNPFRIVAIGSNFISLLDEPYKWPLKDTPLTEGNDDARKTSF